LIGQTVFLTYLLSPLIIGYNILANMSAYCNEMI